MYRRVRELSEIFFCKFKFYLVNMPLCERHGYIIPGPSFLRICEWLLFSKQGWGLSNSYTMGCPPVREDNPRALASGLSYVQVEKHGITILYHLHQCRPCTARDMSC